MAAFPRRDQEQLGRIALLAAVLVACHAWAAAIGDTHAGVIWDPAPGVALAVVILRGWRYAIAVVPAALLGTMLIDVALVEAGSPGTSIYQSVGSMHALAYAVATGGVFAAGGLVLRRVGFDATLSSYGAVGVLLAASWGLAVVSGGLAAVVLQRGATVQSLLETAARTAESQAVGVISTTPVLLLLATVRGRDRPWRRASLRGWTVVAEASAFVAVPLVAVALIDTVNVLFVVAVPFFFTAARRGEPGASIAVSTQTAAVAIFVAVLQPSVDRAELVLALWLLGAIALVLGHGIETRLESNRTERHLLAALEGSRDMVFLVDSTGKVFWMNAAALALRPGPGDVQFASLVAGGQASLTAVDAILRHEPSWSGESQFRRPDGQLMPVWVTVTPDRIVDDVILGYSVVARDMTEHHRLTAELTHQALYDELTGVANRFLLASRLDDAIGRIRRHGGVLAVLLIDLDRFKVVNDSLGHAFGDDVLVALVERLRARLRATDTLARLGGDEFCVLAEGLEDMAAAIRLGDELVDLLAAPVTVDQRTVVLGGSIGVVEAFPEDTSTDLLRRADLAMYDAKARGGGRQSLFDTALAAGADRRLAVEHHLRALLPDSILDYAVQPVVGACPGPVTRGEALLRIVHPDLGALAPTEVLDTVRDAGMLDDFTRASVRSVARIASRLPRGFQLSMNLSPDQLQLATIVDLVATAIADVELPPGCLSIEVTEDSFLDDAEETVDRLRTLHELGCRIALDDFGSGWSSLAMLQTLDLDVLKLDRTLLADIGTSHAAASIVETSVLLAHRLGLEVVAEGIETAEQSAAAIGAGVQWLQGYHHHRPMSVDELLEMVSPEVPASL